MKAEDFGNIVLEYLEIKLAKATQKCDENIGLNKSNADHYRGQEVAYTDIKTYIEGVIVVAEKDNEGCVKHD